MIEKSLPAYRQVADAIAKRIEDGELKPGDAIPSVRAIATEWDVSLTTAQRAHQHLHTLGLTSTVKGIGSVVGLSSGTAQDRIRTALKTGKIYGPGEWARIVSSALVEAPNDVAEAMGCEPGSSVIRRERITHKEDVPVSASVSWMPGEWADACPELLTCERIQSGAQMLAVERLGLNLVGGSGHEQAWAGPADEFAESLHVDPKSIVLRSCNSVALKDGTVIEYATGAKVQGREVSFSYTY